jgi:lipopolysaccharide export LptBFGC system permease protein LptF
MKLHWYMFKDTAFAAALAIVCCSIPVTFVSVFANLEAITFHYKPFLVAAYGLLPMITYMIIPAAVSIAVVWCYGNYYQDHIIAVMQAAGISPLAIRLPAITAAGMATAFALFLSMVVAPASAKSVQDIIHMLRFAPRPYLLEAGKFYTFDGGKRTLFFQSRESDEKVSGVFLRERNDAGREFVLTSQNAVFQQTKKGVRALLVNGQVQVYAPGEKDIQVFEFATMARSTPLTGDVLPARDWTAEYERGPIDFFTHRVTGDSYAARLWTREGVKRFCIPLMTLSHTFFGLGLLALFGAASGRQRQLIPVICCALIVVHIGFVVLEESVQRVGTIMAAATVLAMLLEYLAGLFLIIRAHRRSDLKGQ